MSLKESGSGTHILSRDRRTDSDKNARYPAPNKGTMKGGVKSPRRERTGRDVIHSSKRDRIHEEPKDGRDGRPTLPHRRVPKSPIQRRASRSPTRRSRHNRIDDGETRSVRPRIRDEFRRRSSVDPHLRKDLSRERRARSPDRTALPPPPPRSMRSGIRYGVSQGLAMRNTSPRRFSMRNTSPRRLSMRNTSPRLAMRKTPPRLAMRNTSPPRLPIRNKSPPGLALRNASSEIRRRQGSPHVRPPIRHGSPMRHGSIRPPGRYRSPMENGSPCRTLMRNESPHLMQQLPPPPPPLPHVPLSPQIPIKRPPELPSTLDEYVGMHTRDAILNGAMSEVPPSSAFTNVNDMKDVGDVLKNCEEESLSSYGMLVPGSIVLEDGTVRTFYSLPPDPLSSSVTPSMDPGLGENMMPRHTDGLHQFGLDSSNLRHVNPKRETPLENQGGQYSSSQEHNFMDRKLSSQNQYITGERIVSGWPEKAYLQHSSYRMERPPSPYGNTNDGLSQRRTSRSPIRDGLRGYGRDGRINPLERSSGRFIEQRELPHAPDLFRHGQISPQRRPSSNGEFRVDNTASRRTRQDELRLAEENKLSLQRGSLPLHERILDQNFGHRDCMLYEGTLRRRLKSPQQDALRYLEEYPVRMAFKSDENMFLSHARNDFVSPRKMKMRSLTPPHPRRDMDEDMRKRKYGEFAEGFPFERNSFEPELKRWHQDVDVSHDNHHFGNRRSSGWDVKDEYFGKRIERPDNRNPSLAKLLEERGGLSWSQRPHLDDMKPRDNLTGRRKHIIVSERTAKLDQTGLEHEIPADLPENSTEFKQQVERIFLKYAKTLNEDSEERKKYEKEGKAGMLPCLACGRDSKMFEETQSLISHTFQSRKRGLRAEHLGLCKALCTVLGWNSDMDSGGRTMTSQNLSVEEAKANREDLILWPPVVLIHSCSSRIVDRQHQDFVESSINGLFKELGLPLDRIKVCVGRLGTTMVKYMPILSCLHEAEHLHQHFVSCLRGREQWVKLDPTKSEKEQKNAEEKNTILYGYLGLAHDLDKVDLDFHRRCVVRSRKQIDVIASDVPPN